MNSLPKIIFTDIDGVWTDGGMYYDNSENEFKKFNTADSAGVLYCKILKIPVAIITGEDTRIVRRRAEKLKIEYLYQGIQDKLRTAQGLCDKLHVALSETAFIGDDLTDVPLLKKVGFSGCPSNAPGFVKAVARYCTSARGGDGAFREFVEAILKSNHLLDQTVAKAIAQYEGNP